MVSIFHINGLNFVTYARRRVISCVAKPSTSHHTLHDHDWTIICCLGLGNETMVHDDVIKWKHFLRYWPFVRRIHRSSVNSPHKGQWREALMFSLICTWANSWTNNGDAGDLRRHRPYYEVIFMMHWMSFYILTGTVYRRFHHSLLSKATSRLSIEF